jgi:hypothetical protein
MHGKVFLLDSIYAGIDESFVYGRMDFAHQIPEGDYEIVVNLESWAENSNRPRRALRLNAEMKDGKIERWSVSNKGDTFSDVNGAAVALARNFELKLPLAWLYALPPESNSNDRSSPAATKIRLRFSVWQNKLPVDALPVEGWMELRLLPEDELVAWRIDD